MLPCPCHSGGDEQAGQGQAAAAWQGSSVMSGLASPPQRRGETDRQTERRAEGCVVPARAPLCLHAPWWWLLSFAGDLGEVLVLRGIPDVSRTETSTEGIGPAAN